MTDRCPLCTASTEPVDIFEPVRFLCQRVELGRCRVCDAQLYRPEYATSLWTTYDAANAVWRLRALKLDPLAIMAAVDLAETYYQRTQTGTLNSPEAIRDVANARVVWGKHRPAALEDGDPTS